MQWLSLLVHVSHVRESKNLTLLKKLEVMDKSGYDFRIQRAEIDKEDTKYFKQLNRYRHV
jgi:hypothetical protein